MRLFSYLLAALVATLGLSAPVLAQEDAEGAKDHPLVSRYPGYRINDYDEQEFGAADFRLPDNAEKRVEGKYWQISYELKEGAKKGGPIQIGRNYINAFTAKGGAKVFEDLEVGGGVAVASLPVKGKTIWLQVDVYNGGNNYTLTIVEEAGMAQKVEFSASELAEALNTKGSVAIHGILFDTGKATIKPESADALAPIGGLLKSDAALKLEIQGHTDNVGDKAANLKLSQDRAAAVKDYLVKTFGIGAARLTTAGFGDTKPVGSNTTDEGRAQNRRVELVKK
jgi:OOP family OmpA-OmpF porin